jgi:hypothetical protein
VIIAFAEPCLPGLAVEKETTLQGNSPFIMRREPGFLRPASTRVMLAAPASP